METVWLAGSNYIGGTDDITIADLLLACEVEQLCLLNAANDGHTMDSMLRNYSRVYSWIHRVRGRCNPRTPHYNNVHKLLWSMSSPRRSYV